MDTQVPHGAIDQSAIEQTGIERSATVQRIEAEFPGWGVWRSDTDRWWAYRTARSPLSFEQLRAGCRLIVQADTGEELREAIRAEIAQAEIAQAEIQGAETEPPQIKPVEPG